MITASHEFLGLETPDPIEVWISASKGFMRVCIYVPIKTWFDHMTNLRNKDFMVQDCSTVPKLQMNDFGKFICNYKKRKIPEKNLQIGSRE